jgi:hypothetical protein
MKTEAAEPNVADAAIVETAVGPAKTALKRRNLLSNVGISAAGLAAATAVAGGGILAATVPAQAATIGDGDIVNFALNLEYVEAEFYLRAVTGQGLAAGDTTGTGTLGAVTGGSAVPFKTPQYASLAAAICIDEQAHVKFLRAALGSYAVARPAINFTQAFTTLAQAAGLITAGQTFNPFADEISFLLGAFIFEDVGVTAYGGAAALISSPTILSYAASILAVEAYHSGAIRANLYNIGGGAPVQAISNLRGALSLAAGGFSGDSGILKSDGTDIQLVPVDSQAQTYRRTTTQVLNIVYGGGTNGGLFLPNKMNGLIA